MGYTVDGFCPGSMSCSIVGTSVNYRASFGGGFRGVDDTCGGLVHPRG